MEKTTYAGGFQLLLLAGFVLIAILFLLTQQNTLKAVRPEYRLMQPGWVWLQLIPLFGLVWQFVVVARISISIRKQLQAGNEDSILGFTDAEAVDASVKKPTLIPGILYCSLYSLVIFLNLFLSVSNPQPLLVGSLAIAMLVCWIVYWVSLAAYKRKLKRMILAII